MCMSKHSPVIGPPQCAWIWETRNTYPLFDDAHVERSPDTVFVTRKVSVHLLGVYWTCIGRCVDNREGNRSEQSPALEIKQCALIWETPKAVPSISTRSFVTGAPATQQERDWLVRKCSGNSLVCTTSVTASRPPGRSTRKDS